MARGNLASGDLIEVAAAPPRAWHPTQLDGSGILPALTGELLVIFKTEARPSFDLTAGFRTAATREAGYWLVARLEGISQALPEKIATNIPHRVCRSLQRGFAKLFVLPRPRLADGADSRHRLVGDLGYRFEVSRRVFTFQDEQAKENRLICHVLSEREHRTTDRLLIEFATAIREGHEPGEIRCDEGSGLCLWSRHSGSLAGKIYREVVIAPPEVLPKAQSARADIGLSSGQAVIDDPEQDSMKPFHEIKAAEPPSVSGTKTIYDAFDERLYRRSEADWEFVADKIAAAQGEGRSLDEDFIETVARERLALAGTYAYSNRPDAGPTLESSIGIVRSIVRLHLTALDQSEAEEAS